MSRINIGKADITKSDILDAIAQYKKEIEEETFDINRVSSTYDLIYENEEFPPKYLAELAYNLKNPNSKIGPSNHSADTDINLLRDVCAGGARFGFIPKRLVFAR